MGPGLPRPHPSGVSAALGPQYRWAGPTGGGPPRIGGRQDAAPARARLALHSSAAPPAGPGGRRWATDGHLRRRPHLLRLRPGRATSIRGRPPGERAPVPLPPPGPLHLPPRRQDQNSLQTVSRPFAPLHRSFTERTGPVYRFRPGARPGRGLRGRGRRTAASASRTGVRWPPLRCSPPIRRGRLPGGDQGPGRTGVL